MASFYSSGGRKIPLILLSAVSSVVTLLAQKGGGAFISIEVLPISLRLANALDSCFGYLSKMIIPVNLAFFYPMGREILYWQIAMYAILLSVITILVIAAMRRYPFLFVGWFWYVGTLVPVIGIVQVGTQAMADRYTYVPLIGIFIMAAWGMKSIAEKYSWAKFPFSTISIALIPVLIVMTGQQAMIWSSSETLFTHALVVTERNHVAHNNLAAVFLQSGRLQEAIPHIRRALEISPLDAQANGNMGAAFFMQQRYEDAERHLRRALEVEPSNVSFQGTSGDDPGQSGKRRSGKKAPRRNSSARSSTGRRDFGTGPHLHPVGKQSGGLAAFVEGSTNQPGTPGHPIPVRNRTDQNGSAGRCDRTFSGRPGYVARSGRFP